MAEKMLTLTESFRTVLRARYPSRPALADEIQTYRYFHSAPWCHCGSRRIDPEAQAADEALTALKDGIMSGAVRLRAIINGGMPHDIESMEINRNEIHVFGNCMDVCEGPRTLRTYRNVSCYPADIDALIGVPDMPARRVTARSAAELVRSYISTEPNPTVDGLRLRATRDGIVGGRDIYEPEFRKQMRDRGHIVRRGRRSEPRAN